MEPALADQIVSVKSLFAAHFGGACNVVVGAPGRVNLIGEHVSAPRRLHRAIADCSAGFSHAALGTSHLRFSLSPRLGSL